MFCVKIFLFCKKVVCLLDIGNYFLQIFMTFLRGKEDHLNAIPYFNFLVFIWKFTLGVSGWVAVVSDPCDPMDGSPPGPSVHGISQARVLAGMPFPSPRDLPNSGIKTTSPAWQVDFSLLNHQGSPYPWCAFSHSVVSNSLQPYNCSLLGFSSYRTLQARILEWVAISPSRGSSQPSDQIHISCVSCIAGKFLVGMFCLFWFLLIYFFNWRIIALQNFVFLRKLLFYIFDHLSCPACFCLEFCFSSKCR